MCGLVAVVTAADQRPELTEPGLIAMRDRLAHRGPDDATLWSSANAMLAHRRLAVIDPTPAGAQPMLTPDERFVLVYNGELYNDADVRANLAREGVEFRTHCDTETLLLALRRWGVGALARVRGMYAFALLDRADQTLLIARDPLGIKPLYVHRRALAAGGTELVVASEIPAILAHPRVSADPDFVTISAYLTTLRSTLGSRTLFRGIETLRPGEWRRYDLRRAPLPCESATIEPDAVTPGACADLRAAIDDAVDRHCRSDVPMCCLLSGGLDSTIITARAHARAPDLRTFCAGAETDEPSADLAVADRVAAELGTRHTRAPISRDLFRERWPDLVGRTGLPLTTPNTVAIYEVARTLRDAGCVVTLSGEGADELFGGYAPALELAALHEMALDRPSPGRFHLDSNGWVPVGVKSSVVRASAYAAAEEDTPLFEQYEADFAACAERAPGDSPMQAHLRFHRRVNLPNLLERLDLATMLASVEGRTPFADAPITALAERLPMAHKFERSGEDAPARTKIALRGAYAGAIPEEPRTRAKASFPLPFQAWVGDHTEVLDAPFARDLFTDAALAGVRANPGAAWSFAWPMINVALWSRRWWG